MNKIEMLYDVMGEALDKYNPLDIGSTLYVKLDTERRIKICLYETWARDNYDAITLNVVNKNDGNIDNKTIKFSDLFKCMQDLTHPNKIGKHIWYNNGEYRWYGKPTQEDLDAIRKAVVNYIELWR